MKFYLRVAGVVAIVALIIWLLQEFGGSDPAPPPVAVATPAPTAVPAVALVATPAPTLVPTVAPARPAPVQVAMAQPTVPAFIPRAAQSAHVTITGTQRTDDWWFITVVGRDRNALNDFLDAAYKFGLRDVDVNYQAYKQFVVRGELRAQNTYKMRF